MPCYKNTIQNGTILMISLHVILTGFDKHILLPEQEKQFKKREKLLTKDEWYTLFSKVLYSVIVYITCGAHTYLIFVFYHRLVMHCSRFSDTGC